MRLRRSLNKKITFISLFFLLTGILINTSIQSSITVRKYTDSLKERARLIINLMKYELEYELQSEAELGRLKKVDLRCKEIIQSGHEMSYLFVTDTTGRILFGSDFFFKNAYLPLTLSARLAQDISANPSYEFQLGDFNNLLVPIWGPEGKRAGSIVIGYALQLVSDRVIEIIVGSAAVMFALCLILVISLLGLQQRWLTRPLGQIVDLLEEVRLKGVKSIQEMPQLPADEFGQLLKTIYALISNLRETQQSLENHAAFLEEKVRERTAELNATNERLLQQIQELKRLKAEEQKLQDQLMQAQKMEAVGNLAAGVAHDLNNILSGLVNYPELLLLELPADSPFIKPLASIKRAGERAAAVVQDLLIMARRGIAHTVSLELNSLMQAVLEGQSDRSFLQQYPGVALDLSLAPHLPAFAGNLASVNRSLYNLCQFAYEEAAPEGRIAINTFYLQLEEPLHAYEEIPPGAYVCLQIATYGKGFSEDELKHLFEPFYLKRVLKRANITGLGLAIVYYTVKEHKGYLDVLSQPEKATTITLYWPALPFSLSSRDDVTKEYQGMGERILVVDDNAEQREIAQRLLLKLGYSPFTAASGEEAIRFLAENDVDLVILDMIMEPGLDGLETFRKIRQLKPEQKALVASGFAETSRVIAMQQMGAGDFISKPYSLEQIGKAIKKELKSSRQKE